MTRATVVTRAAAAVTAAVFAGMSLVACGGDDSGAEEPVEETVEQTDESVDDEAEAADRSKQRRDRDQSATRDEDRDESSAAEEETASETSSATSESKLLTAKEFCTLYTRYETNGVFADADTPKGARRAADRLERLAERAPRALVEDIELMARLFAEIAAANGDRDKLAQIDASGLPETKEHLERWRKKHC